MPIDNETQEFFDSLENMSWSELQEVLMNVNIAVAEKQKKNVFPESDNVH